MELICSVLKAQRLYSPKENEILTEPPSSLNMKQHPTPPTTWIQTKQQFEVILDPQGLWEETIKTDFNLQHV